MIISDHRHLYFSILIQLNHDMPSQILVRFLVVYSLTMLMQMILALYRDFPSNVFCDNVCYVIEDFPSVSVDNSQECLKCFSLCVIALNEWVGGRLHVAGCDNSMVKEWGIFLHWFLVWLKIQGIYASEACKLNRFTSKQEHIITPNVYISSKQCILTSFHCNKR